MRWARLGVLLLAACRGGGPAEPEEPATPPSCAGPAVEAGEVTPVVMADTEDLCPLYAAVGVAEAADVAEAHALMRRYVANDATVVSCPGTDGLADTTGMTVSCYVEVRAASVPACRAFAAALLVRHARDHHRVNLSIDCHPGQVSARTSQGDFEVDVGDDFWAFRLPSPTR